MYSLNWKNVLESFAKKPVRYMVQPWIDEKVQTEVLYTAVPHRMDLVDIYKSLLSEEGSLAITLEDFSKLLHMNVIKCELSLRILANLKLIKLEGDETYHISVLPRPAQKLELDQTAIFKKISSLRDDFFEYIKYYKEVIK
jgi:predicted RNA-binding protein (virulence factor B family)